MGRLPRPLPEEERTIILRCEDEEMLNPVAVERAIERRHGIHIPHNRLWRVLKEDGRVADSLEKQRRRAWVRFERRFSNALWQMDYTLLRPGEWLQVFWVIDANQSLVTALDLFVVAGPGARAFASFTIYVQVSCLLIGADGREINK